MAHENIFFIYKTRKQKSVKDLLSENNDTVILYIFFFFTVDFSKWVMEAL